MPHLYFYLASFAWNVGYGMCWVVIPLYAAEQGLSLGQIGALIALPVVIQLPLNLLSGAYTDRIGGRSIMLIASASMVCAAVWFAFAQGFLMLFFAHLVLVFSRAMFWPATWAMASELPGAKGVQLGRLNATTNIGQIAGSVLGGVLLGWASFVVAFVVLASMGVVTLTASLGTTRVSAAARPRPGLLDGYLPLLRNVTVRYCMLCAYLAAIPLALSLSFYPLLMAHYGYGGEVSGAVIALRSVGAICAALLVARFVKGGADSPWPLWCGGAIAIATGMVSVVESATLIGLWLLVAGVASGAMTLYFQITLSEASRSEERGSALALGGIGWNVSMLTTPLATGMVADRLGLVPAFYAASIFAIACTTALVVFRRRLR